ncbi:MAG TPA: DNA replication/repair protein RecF [Dehalococcoidia bacterium]|nr:DNA replication/repair protein RecF [Dehalococcoidia bacterium]
MYITHVALANFRTYRKLEHELPPGLVLIHGANAQGKTNFLEALYVLATSRSPRTTKDRELISWNVPEHEAPVAHLSARLRHAAGEAAVEIFIVGKPDHGQTKLASPEEELDRFLAPASGVQKRIRVNGVLRRAVDLLGTLRVVLFRPEDLELVSGPPAGRRRALDILLSQLDGHYTRTLQRYGRILLQRNHLLRRLAEGRASPDELDPWDESLCREGAYLLATRYRALDRLTQLATECHAPLGGGQEDLETHYQSTVHLDEAASPPEVEVLSAAFREQLRSWRRRETMLGQTIIGPHRDDLALLVNGAAAATYGSRGQQRTVALAWKLAEARYQREVSGEDPVVLLDDVLSELDTERRRSVLEAVKGYQQVFLTTTSAELPSAAPLPAASFLVRDGQLIPETP